MERICPECGKPLPEGCHYQRVFHDECGRKRWRKKQMLKQHMEKTGVDIDYNKRVYKADEFWNRIAMASQLLGTSYGYLEHEAFKRGMNIGQLMDRLGV